MNTLTKVALCSLCGIGIGLLIAGNHSETAEVKQASASAGDDKGNAQSAYDDAPAEVSKETAQPPVETPAPVVKVPMNPDTRPRAEEYQRDLQKYGTRQGLIEVGYQLAEKEQRTMARKMLDQRQREVEKTAALYDQLKKGNESLQISLTNTSSQARQITLWDSSSPLTPLLPGDGEGVVQNAVTGVHPQGIIFNPFNNNVYVANQLSNTVAVLDAQGTVVATVVLSPNTLPGANSPVALAAHAVSGKVYVAGSVANTISVIDADFRVSNVIDTGSRPVAVVYNPVNERIYVANLRSNDVTVIDASTEQVVATLPAQHQPRGIAVNPENGDIYIVNSGSNTIKVYSAAHVELAVIPTGENPVSAFWHPVNRKIYAAIEHGDEVMIIDPASYSVYRSIATGEGPYGMAYHPVKQTLYIGNRGDGTITALSLDDTVQSTFAFPGINIGLIVNPVSLALVFTNTSFGRLGTQGGADPIVTDMVALQNAAAHFRFNPSMISHMKMVLPGSLGINQLRVAYRTITGKTRERSISLSSYESPQHFQRVYEVSAMKGVVLDARARWRFLLLANQTVTFLIYYQSFEKEKLVPGMGRSVPAHQ